MNFEVLKADIVKLKMDAIVLPANEHLKEGKGASRAIFKAAGRTALTKACKEVEHCNMGSAVPTLGYRLHSKYIVHAVVPHWVDGRHNEYDLLISAYVTALNVADVMGCESIAFPLLASGSSGFDKELAIQIAMESIHQFSGENLKKVYLVAFEDRVEMLFRMQGFDVITPPEEIVVEEEEKALPKILHNTKDAAQKLLVDQLQKANEWLQDKDNQKKLVH